MSKTYLFSLIVIGVFLFVVKPVNKKEEIGVQDSHIANDFESGGFIASSSKKPISSKPTYTL